MFKLSTLIALFICLVYCNNEHVGDTQSPMHESQITKDDTQENNNTFQTVKGQYTEETKKSKPCKKNKSRRLNDEDNTDVELFESLPLTATLEETKTANTGNKIITSFVHGTNYNIKNENPNVETDNTDLNSKNCILEANKKVLQFESLELGGNSNSFSNIANIESKFGETRLAHSDDISFKKEETDESESDDMDSMSRYNGPSNFNIDKNSTSFEKEATEKSTLDDKVSIFRDNVPMKFDTGEFISERPCKKANNLNASRRKCGKINLSEISPTTSSSRRILPGIIENPTNQESKDNKLYQDRPQVNYNNEKKSSHDLYDKPVSVKESGEELYQDDPLSNRQGEEEMENRHSYFPNVQKVSNSYGIDLVHNMNINEISKEDQPENSDKNQLTEPTKGRGIYDMKDVGVMLLENSRVCYACSTISDPTCWAPNTRTTVKYCKKGHHSCLTKSFRHRGRSVIIRDCGSYCVDSQNGDDDYSSCSICHSDLCNGAVSVSIYGTSFAIITSFGILFNTHYIKV